MMKLLSFFLLIIFAGCSTKQDPVNNLEWKISGELPAMDGQSKAPGVAGPVTGISGGALIIAGGANFPDSMPWLGGKKKYYSEGYIFKKDAVDSLVFYKRVSLPSSVAYAATCTTAEGILAAGGENENGLRKTAFLIQWNGQKEEIIIRDLPDLPVPLTNASAVYLDNKIYLAGGERTNEVSNQFFEFDLADTVSGWKVLAPLAKPVSHAVLVAAHGNIYLIGGRKKNSGRTSDLYADVLAYDVRSGTWTAKSSLPFALSAGTGASIDGRYIFIFGGDTGETFHETELLLASIAKEADDSLRAGLNLKKAELQSSHPGFSRQVLMYDTKMNIWKHFDSIPFPSVATTTAVSWKDDVIIPSGEIRAGVRTPKILSAKFK